MPSFNARSSLERSDKNASLVQNKGNR
jgi:hypothetical protein